MRLLLAGGGHSHIEVLKHLRTTRQRALTVTLVTPEVRVGYSGMLPGTLAGCYDWSDAQIDVAALARAAGARFVASRVAAIDLAAAVARLENGTELAFDLVALDVGSVPDGSVPGVSAHAVAVKPFAHLLKAWQQVVVDAGQRTVRDIAVVGGGAAGIEMLLSMERFLARRLGDAAPHWTLVTDQAALLVQHSGKVRERIERLLAERNVTVHLSGRVVAVEAGALILDDRRIEADRVFWAVSAATAPFLRESGLACDPRGFVLVDACLRSTSHPFLFASGDCAAMTSAPVPKSGAYAIRQGRLLAANLLRAAAGEPVHPFTAPQRSLALIGTGDGKAVLSYGPLAAQGAWVWRLKDFIDRRYVAGVGDRP